MDSPDPTRWSALGRPVDPAFPTNRAVLLALPPAAVLGALFSGTGALTGALVGAGAAFAGWALTREFAPDHPGLAFVGMGLALASVVTVGRPALLPAFALLMSARVVNRTVGPPPRLADTAAVTALAAWAVVDGGGWPMAVAAATAFGADRALTGPAPARHGAVAVAFAAGAVWAALGAAAPHPPGLPILVAGTAVLVAYGVAIARTDALRSRTDVGDAPLSEARVRAGMATAPLVLAASLAGWGLPTAELTVVWAAVAATALGALRPPPRS